MKSNILKYGVISVFILLYLIVSTISMIHSIDFFSLSNSYHMALSLATAFEVGQVAALCGILILDKTNKTIVWSLFILLTSMQIMSNVYFSFKNMGDFSTWSELFGLIDEDASVQKRALSIISGGILPVVSLGFIKSLVDYIKPESNSNQEQPVQLIEKETAQVKNEEPVEEAEPLQNSEPAEKTLVTKQVEQVKKSDDHYSIWKKNKK
jgi:hypothetical protein